MLQFPSRRVPNVQVEPLVLATINVGETGHEIELGPSEAVRVMSPALSAAVTLTVGVVSLV